jgi:Tat protein secretion system quality control protein TatD with DNase activity
MDISKLFCETDEAPSKSIEEVYMEVAKLRNISVNTLLDHIENNYKTLFDKDPLLG